MISNLDIYRAADLLIERHGVDAVVEAAARLIDRMLYRGDRGGRSYTGQCRASISPRAKPEFGRLLLISDPGMDWLGVLHLMDGGARARMRGLAHADFRCGHLPGGQSADPSLWPPSAPRS